MNRRFYYSQKVYLFFAYGLLVTMLLFLFFICFYYFYSQNIYKDATTKSETLSASVHNSVSTELKNMSTISMNIVYSNAIKKNFTSFAKNSNDTIETEKFFPYRENVLAIYDIITAIIGPFQSASQVNLYTLNGTCIGSGYFQGVTYTNLQSIPWYKETIQKNGAKNISLTTNNLLNNPKKSKTMSGNNFLSLTRVFFNSSNEPEGIVEVLQDCDVIFSLISELKQKNPSTSFYVYNEKNELIYPYTLAQGTDTNYVNIINNNSLVPSMGYFIDITPKDSVLMSYQKIDSYNWTIVTSEPKEEVFKPLNSFKEGFVFIIIISIFFTLLLCFLISSRLTHPLSKLTSATKKVTINRVLNENESILTSINTNVLEISELFQSFQDMYTKLKDSSHEILLLKKKKKIASNSISCKSTFFI
jgi:HAMP domain.